MDKLLVFLVFLPLASGALFLFFRSRAAKYSALVISIIELILAGGLFIYFLGHPLSHYGVNIPWIRGSGIHLELDLDGINLLFVLLTGISVPIIMLAAWDKTYHNYGLMDGLILILQGSLMGVFLSFNAFVFYIFWEMTLIPAYLILLLWGGEQRMQITLKFFIYTLAGSLLMLVALILIYLSTPGHSFSHQAFLSHSLDASGQSWLFFALMLAFMIKTAVFPFHSWQPETYTQAPSAGTMLLSGLMSKMGIFGILRWLIPVLPLATKQYAPWVIGISVFSLLYSSVIALRQKNVKTLFAFSSIAHLSVVMAAVFTLGAMAIQGALLMIFSHGIVIIGLFYVADIFKTRTDSQWLTDLGGIRSIAPVFASLYLVVLLASIGLPLTSGFPGELFMLIGMAKYNLWIGGAVGLGFILGAAYMLDSYRTAMLGEAGTKPFPDLKTREIFVFAVIILLIFFIGLFPGILLRPTETGVDLLINQYIIR